MPKLLKQKNVLRSLVLRAAGSPFGEFYSFNKLLLTKNVVKRFQQTVPLHDYNELHDKWWKNIADHGGKHTTWRKKVKYFALTSGTSGAPSKRIPVTSTTMHIMQRVAANIFRDLVKHNDDVSLNTLAKQKLMLGGSLNLQEDESSGQKGDLSGIYANNMPYWMSGGYKPGREIGMIDKWDDRIDAIVKEAKDWDIVFLAGFPSWLLLTLERIMEHYKIDSIHEIWPNLRIFIHGGVPMEPYKKKFDDITSKPLICVDTYLASEGFFAYQKNPNDKGMTLVLNSGVFFEFIPMSEYSPSMIGKPIKTLLISEIEEDVDYVLIVSNTNGMWRYVIGDTVKFIDKEKKIIVISGRVNQFLSVCGEHLSIHNMDEAIVKTEEALGVNIREYTVNAVVEDGKPSHKWYIATNDEVSKNLLDETLDNNLRLVNDDYGVERDYLLGYDTEIISPQIVLDYQHKIGKVGGQAKFPRVMKKHMWEEWEEFVKNN